ncbi:hypothetical protein [Campylobacter showae]|uniref:hypothetical protein n=1 Tax=Campylobacter showae TaxID=204 RepID=UPI0028D253B3|nr:hypothetical protein [Campylobacter showae]
MKRLIFLLFVLLLGTLGAYMIEGKMPNSDNIAGGLFFGTILAVPIFALLNAFGLAPCVKDHPTPNIDFLFDEGKDGSVSIFVASALIFSGLIGFFSIELALACAFGSILFQGVIKFLISYIFYAKL